MTTTPFKSSRSLEAFENGLRHLEHALQAMKKAHERASLKTSAHLKIPVIGEFSSGKTRLLSELIAPHVTNPELLPVSDIAPETAIPLEITYDTATRLTLHTPSAEPQKHLRFPQRKEVSTDLPTGSKFVLTIPEPSLNLTFAGASCPLSLVDTPGWDSGNIHDDEHRRFIPDNTPAAICVCKTTRLEKDYSEFLENLFDDLDIYSQHLQHLHLLFYVTDWTEDVHNRRALAEFHARTQQIHDATNWNVKFTVHPPVPVQFHEISKSDLAAFRADFWKKLRATLPPQRILLNAVEPSPWCIRTALSEHIAPTILPDALRDTVSTLQHMRTFIDRFFADGQIVPGQNFTRLNPFPHNEWPQLLQAHWQRRLESEKIVMPQKLVPPPALPPTNAFAVWWNEVLRPQIRDTIHTLCNLAEQATHAFNCVCDTTGSDLNEIIQQHLQPHYYTACDHFDDLDRLFPDAVISMITGKHADHATIIDALTVLIATTAACFAIDQVSTTLNPINCHV